MFVKATLRAVFKLLLLKLGVSKQVKILFCESFRNSFLTEDQLKTKWDKFLRKYVACARSLSTCAKPFFFTHSSRKSIYARGERPHPVSALHLALCRQHFEQLVDF